MSCHKDFPADDIRLREQVPDVQHGVYLDERDAGQIRLPLLVAGVIVRPSLLDRPRQGIGSVVVGVFAELPEGFQLRVEVRVHDFPAFGHVGEVHHVRRTGEDAGLLVGQLVEPVHPDAVRPHRAELAFHVAGKSPASVVAFYVGHCHPVLGQHAGDPRLCLLHRSVRVDNVKDEVADFGVQVVYRAEPVLAGVRRVRVVLAYPAVRVGYLPVCPELAVQETFERGGVLHVLRVEHVRVYPPYRVQLVEPVLELPQRPLPAAGAFQDGGERQDLPLSRLGTHEVPAQVLLVQTLHDNHYGRSARVDTVAYRGLETLVHLFAPNVGERVLRLYGVVYHYRAREQERAGGNAVHLVGHVVHVSRAEARYLPAGGSGVHAASGCRHPLLLGIRAVLYLHVGEQPAILVRLDDVPYLLGIVVGKVVRIGQVDELGRRVQRKTGGDEVLHRKLRLSVPGADVYYQLLRLARQHAVQRVAYRLVVLPHVEGTLVHPAEHVPGVVQHPRQAEGPQESLSVHHVSSLIIFFASSTDIGLAAGSSTSIFAASSLPNIRCMSSRKAFIVPRAVSL